MNPSHPASGGLVSRPAHVPDLVVLGNLIVDDLVFADGTTRTGEPGGAVLYAALGASLWGTRVGVVSPVGDNYPEAVLDTLSAHGVDLGGLRRLGRPGLRAWLLYEPAGRRIVHHPGSPTHAEATPGPADLPSGWHRCPGFHLTPAPLHAQGDLIGALSTSRGSLVSVDPHDPVTAASLEPWRHALAGVDVLFASEAELPMAGALAGRGLIGVVRSLTSGRLRLVALKRGNSGGIVVDLASERFATWPPRAARVVDPTGAGDAFAGGALAALVSGGTLDRALAQGVVAASFALEAWGAAGLLSARPADAARRLAEWFGAPDAWVDWRGARDPGQGSAARDDGHTGNDPV